jgi:hypothetical protein
MPNFTSYPRGLSRAGKKHWKLKNDVTKAWREYQSGGGVPDDALALGDDPLTLGDEYLTLGS